VADPERRGVTALVQAAASGNTGDIDRLLGDGGATGTEAPAPLPGGKFLFGSFMAGVIGGMGLYSWVTGIVK
jgi:hypothetical protein